MALTNEKPTAAKKIVCDNCDNEDAVQSRCNECGMFLCQFCTQSHKRSRSTKQHNLLTIDELKSSAGPQSIAEKMKCSKHKDEIIKLFCKTCQATICRDCTIVDHQGHKYGFVEDVAVDEKQHLQQNLDEVKQRKAKVAEGIANLKKFNESLEAKKKSTISEIKKHFGDFITSVEFRKEQMVEKATSFTNSKQKQINAQLATLEVALATCESSIEFTEQAFRSGNDVQILSMEKYILQSLGQLKTIKDQTEPCVTEDMMFSVPSSVKETKEKLLNEYDVDIVVASPEYCRTSFNEAGKVFIAEKQYSITLICYDKNNRRLTRGGQDIKPSFSGMEVSDVAVIDSEDGSYFISFCPCEGGTLKFKVSINGVSAPNCSLTRQVKWVISDVYGEGVITNGGKTMRGDGRDGEYSCRVGGCCFESGIHTWKVQLSTDYLGPFACQVGIIDCDEINANIANSKMKWVYTTSASCWNHPMISLTLDMDTKILNIKATGVDIKGRSDTQNYQFIARRVSPFFACSSPDISLTIME